jgi:hypothetical protein
MNGKQDIEARLDRALAHQIGVPRLGKQFNAAVWARIAAEEAKAAKPVASREPSRALRASRWFAVTNWIGVAVTLGIVAYFMLGTDGGIDASALTPAAVKLGVEVPAVSMPVVTDDMVSQLIAIVGQVLGFAALVFTFSLTSVGRRMRASFS